MSARHLLLLSIVSTIFACTPDKPEDTGTAPPSPPESLDHERIASVFEDLSADDMAGRLTGSPSGEVAENYVLDLLTTAGHEPVLQEVPLPIYDIETPIDLSVMDDAGQTVLALDYITQYREVAFAGSGDATGDLLFLGYGSATDFEGLDVSGKIVGILTTGFFQSSFTRAHENGAAGVLFIPAGSLADYDQYVGDIYVPNLFGTGDPVDSADLIPDLPALLVHKKAVDDLLGKTVADLEADPTPYDTGLRVHMELHGTSYPDAACQNIFVPLLGSDNDVGSEIVLVGAHYDHIGRGGDGCVFNGASDNASGSAVVLELAQSLAQVSPPQRTVVLALWCGEEQGIYGSFYYDDEPLWPLEDTVLVVNLDNIADPPGPYLVREGEYDIQAAFLAPSMDDPIPEMVLDFQCGSDECAFHRDGIPFLRYMDLGSDAHTLDDTFENADVEGVYQVADEVYRGVLALGWGG